MSLYMTLFPLPEHVEGLHFLLEVQEKKEQFFDKLSERALAMSQSQSALV